MIYVYLINKFPTDFCMRTSEKPKEYSESIDEDDIPATRSTQASSDVHLVNKSVNTIDNTSAIPKGLQVSCNLHFTLIFYSLCSREHK